LAIKKRVRVHDMRTKEQSEKNEGELQSEHYVAIVRRLAFLVISMVKACGEDWTPPFEVFITGADDDAVMHFQVDAEGRLRNLIPSDFKLRARFPVTATITDRSGNARELVFSPNDEVQ
jgi:hypothetical protein